MINDKSMIKKKIELIVDTILSLSGSSLSVQTFINPRKISTTFAIETSSFAPILSTSTAASLPKLS